jgi:uncharacterized membrane protein YbhN (UPF0104 family)
LAAPDTDPDDKLSRGGGTLTGNRRRRRHSPYFFINFTDLTHPVAHVRRRTRVNKTHQDDTSPDLSRRSLLQSAAGAGLAATAVTALGVAATSVTAASASAATPAGTSTGTSTAATAPLVVHVRDVKSGDIEVFSGTSQTRVRDRALAARIAQAIS